MFDSLDANVIRSAALQTTGVVGPSVGIDAHGWRRLSTSFKSALNDFTSPWLKLLKGYALHM